MHRAAQFVGHKNLLITLAPSLSRPNTTLLFASFLNPVGNLQLTEINANIRFISCTAIPFKLCVKVSHTLIKKHNYIHTHAAVDLCNTNGNGREDLETRLNTSCKSSSVSVWLPKSVAKPLIPFKTSHTVKKDLMFTFSLCIQ